MIRRLPTPTRTTLRWRLALVYGAVAIAVGVLLLALSYVLVGRALEAGRLPVPKDVGFLLDNGRFVTVDALQHSLRADALGTLLRKGLVALLLLGAVGVSVAYVLAGQVLRPLQAITATARRLSAERLDERIDLPGPGDELKELADVFDAMLDRLEASFDGQRRFVADASHELRTPLAVMRTEVEVALADPDASVADLRAAAVIVRDATERADRLVDSLLLLARSDRATAGSLSHPESLPNPEPVALAEAARIAVAAVSAEIAERHLQIGTSYAPAVVRGDRPLLERLAGNLVENAVRHNVAGGWVRVDTGVVDGRARLQVANSGPVVPAAEVDDLWLPFRRHGPARTARRGAGLGLSIVRAVAAAHGGTATASARPDGGLVVTVELPAAG